MKYRLLFSISLLAVLWITTFQPTKLIAQSDNYTVRIVSPKADSLNHWNKCPGVNYVFQAEGLNSDGSAFDPSQVTFTWDFGYHGQSKSGSVVSFTYPEGGHYTIRLTVTGKSGKPNAQNSPFIEAFIGMKPSFDGTRSDQSSICSGSEIGLTGFVTPVPWTADTFRFENKYEPSDLKWNGISILSDRNGIARIKPPLDKGNIDYVFRVTDDFGCNFDTTMTLYGVSASFSIDPISGEAPLDVTMTVDESTNGGNESDISYTWEFFENSGDTSALLYATEPKFTLERPGEYTARMIAKYQQCSFTYTADKFVKVDSSLLEIPNVFTPNGDGSNDYFQVKALSLKSFHGKIMNRYGRVVFEWTNAKDYEAGWNGKYLNSGKPVPSGTYYYIISAVGYDDKVYKGKVNEKVYYGFLSLFR